MDYKMATHVGISQVDNETGGDELQVDSLSEFLSTLLLNTAVLILVSASLYLTVLAIVTLVSTGLQ